MKRITKDTTVGELAELLRERRLMLRVWHAGMHWYASADSLEGDRVRRSADSVSNAIEDVLRSVNKGHWDG